MGSPSIKNLPSTIPSASVSAGESIITLPEIFSKRTITTTYKSISHPKAPSIPTKTNTVISTDKKALLSALKDRYGISGNEVLAALGVRKGEHVSMSVKPGASEQYGMVLGAQRIDGKMKIIVADALGKTYAVDPERVRTLKGEEKMAITSTLEQSLAANNSGSFYKINKGYEYPTYPPRVVDIEDGEVIRLNFQEGQILYHDTNGKTEAGSFTGKITEGLDGKLYAEISCPNPENIMQSITKKIPLDEVRQ